ncbi:sensor histidine kinase [Sphingomonas crusticola]|uniref:sensor histidine kinase n=1 Tax=Sphingomonas crusticola TaxID=1697973 RepID=UPI000E249EC2|nr:histidine kinase [Sphingomonas crusticola]
MAQIELGQESNGGLSPNRIAILAILLAWMTQFALLTAQMAAAEKAAGMPVMTWSELAARACVTTIGILLSIGMALLLRKLRETPLGLRITMAGITAVAGSLLHALANFGLFSILMPEESMKRASIASYLAATTVWFWTYGAIAALLLVIYYNADLRERDRRLALLRAVAQSAQIKALRYQINPHFMFNTLNSIASLVGRRETAEAEAMVENLSDFLHTTLLLNPEDDIPLWRELELQQLYLSIEAARFPKRLLVEVDVPDELRALLVPSLITQPLIENVIKHAVRKSTTPIELRIVARQVGKNLELVIRNSFGDAAGQMRGPPGIGLANVDERLTMRYPGACRCLAVSDADGFYVRLLMPATGGAVP